MIDYTLSCNTLKSNSWERWSINRLNMFDCLEELAQYKVTKRQESQGLRNSIANACLPTHVAKLSQMKPHVTFREQALGMKKPDTIFHEATLFHESNEIDKHSYPYRYI